MLGEGLCSAGERGPGAVGAQGRARPGSPDRRAGVGPEQRVSGHPTRFRKGGSPVRLQHGRVGEGRRRGGEEGGPSPGLCPWESLNFRTFKIYPTGNSEEKRQLRP